MAPAKGEKCAHLVWPCASTSGKCYGTQCEAMEKRPDIVCSCAHPSCKGKTSQLEAAQQLTNEPLVMLHSPARTRLY
jgi:hypothetical protein